MKRLLGICLTILLSSCVVSPVSARPKHHEASPAINTVSPVIAASNSVIPESSAVYADLEYPSITANSSELWDQLAKAEAYKKLYELQEKSLREELHLYEGPGAAYHFANSSNTQIYSKWSELKSQEYALKLKKRTV